MYPLVRKYYHKDFFAKVEINISEKHENWSLKFDCFYPFVNHLAPNPKKDKS